MSIGEATRKIVEAVQNSIKVALPCTVEKTNGKKVEVKLEDGSLIPDVPIFQMVSAVDCGLILPVKKGTQGAILVFDNDISAWLKNAKEPLTTRKHDLSDCYFISGFTRDSDRPQAGNNAILKNGSMSIEISDGKIKIQGGSKEVLEIVARFMDNAINTLDSIINDPFLIAVGGGSGSHSVALKGEWVLPVTGLKALLERSKSDLESIKL